MLEISTSIAKKSLICLVFNIVNSNRKVKRFLLAIYSLSAWIAIIVYFVLASNLSDKKQRGSVIERVNVVIKDSLTNNFVTPEMVLSWFSSEEYPLKKVEISQLNTMGVARFVEKRKFVKKASAYVDMLGCLTIEIEQRTPIARVSSDNGYNFYITDDNYILPLQSHEVIYVPIITGNFTPPFSREFTGDWRLESVENEKKMSKNYSFFEKLINFVNITRKDLFLNSHIVQMNVIGRGAFNGTVLLEESELELVPRVGNHIIRIGKLSDIDRKLEKLMLLYKHGVNNDLWNSPTYINLEYHGQVVCTKM